jgi:hypothetical protein
MTSEGVARFLRRHCEERLSAEAHRAKAEATKQSIVTVALAVDCFASLAMTVSVACAPRNDGHDFRSPGHRPTDSIFKQPAMCSHSFAISPRDPREFCFEVLPLRDQRAQGMPGAQRARGLACEIKQSTRA